MKELSVFIDESGDFGEYDDQAPYYIITMVFHDQSQAITEAVQKLDQELSYMDLNNLCIHRWHGDETVITLQLSE